MPTPGHLTIVSLAISFMRLLFQLLPLGELLHLAGQSTAVLVEEASAVKAWEHEDTHGEAEGEEEPGEEGAEPRNGQKSNNSHRKVEHGRGQAHRTVASNAGSAEAVDVDKILRDPLQLLLLGSVPGITEDKREDLRSEEVGESGEETSQAAHSQEAGVVVPEHGEDCGESASCDCWVPVLPPGQDIVSMENNLPPRLKTILHHGHAAVSAHC